MADFAAIVDLINLSASRPQTLAEFVHRDESRPADRPFLRLVAYQDGQLVGTASGGRVTWVKEEDMYGHVTVAPAARRHGVATALYAGLESFYREHHPTHLWGWVKDDNPGALAWAEGLGFAVRHHAFESCLDVAAFDPAPYSGRIEQVLAEGFRVVTFDQVRSPEQEYQLYELIQALDRDVPDAGDWDPLPYADWRRHFLDSPRTFPEGCLIAVAPNGTWAGVSALMRSPGEPDRATVDYTGVLRPYRGRGLAMALKLAGIDLARGHGISRIATENHSLNQPMLAINRRLGFQPLAGTYALSKPFTSLVRS